MATTTLPAKGDRVAKDRSDAKPARTMTYPLRETNSGARRPHQKPPKQGEPFDPDDLSRRLHAYLAEQKIRSERRRAYRAAQAAAVTSKDESTQNASQTLAAAGQENTYHHVPMVAAAAFSRTTTPNPLRQIHALSQPAVRTHLEQLHLDDSSGGAKGLKKTQALDQAVAEREMLRQRNQFQRTQSMENAAELDGYRGVFKTQQRSFAGDNAHLAVRKEKARGRPVSTGEVSEDNSSSGKSKPKSKPVALDMSERNNWTQAEQVAEARRKEKEKEKSSPTVRKKQSSWILLGKRSPKADKDKEDGGATLSEVSSPTESKFSKAGFLSRFKRHPS